MYSQAPDLTDAEAEAGGRIAKALKHLGLKGPLDLAEDALAAMDYLVGRLREERAAKEGLRRAYEWKIQDLQQETLRTSALRKQLNTERAAVRELWERLDEARVNE